MAGSEEKKKYCSNDKTNLFIILLLVSDPVIIRLRREEESLDNIGQYWVQCETEELKYNAIANIYGVVTIGKIKF